MKLLLRFVGILLFFNISVSMCLLSLTFVKTADCSGITVNHRVHIEEKYIWVMGEVINNLDEPIGNVSLRIKCYDGNNTLIEEASTTAWLSLILSERRTPFVKSFEKEKIKGFTNCTVDIAHYDICEPKPNKLSFRYAGLSYISASGIQVEGVVKNEGAENATNIIVIGMFYDDKGFLAADSDLIHIPEGLSPGNEEEFKIFSRFVTKPSLFRKYILTAESNNYTLDQEKSKEFPPSDNTEDTGVGYRAIIIILAVITIITASVIAIVKGRSKKKKRKPRRVR